MLIIYHLRSSVNIPAHSIKEFYIICYLIGQLCGYFRIPVDVRIHLTIMSDNNSYCIFVFKGFSEIIYACRCTVWMVVNSNDRRVVPCYVCQYLFEFIRIIDAKP